MTATRSRKTLRHWFHLPLVLTALLFPLVRCDPPPSPDPQPEACPCLSEVSAPLTDTLASRLIDVIRQGSANGFPGDFVRSCDSIRYTYTVWTSIGRPIDPDSTWELRPLPVEVEIVREESRLIYRANTEHESFGPDTVFSWWEVFGAGDSAVCLPNVENVIVDSIDIRLLSRFDFPAWDLSAAISDIETSCGSLSARIVLSGQEQSQTLQFEVQAVSEENGLSVKADLGGQSFQLFASDAWCIDLGMQ